MRIPRLPAALLLVLLTACAPGNPAFDRTPDAIALDASPTNLGGEWCRDFFIVSAHINGAGPYRLLLDTGATATIVDPAVAAAHPEFIRSTSRTSTGSSGGRVRAQAEFHISALVSGGVTLKDFDALVVELDHVTRILGPLDGILGYSVLSGTTFTIDYPARTVAVAHERLDPKAPRAPAEAWFKYSDPKRPFIFIEVAGRKTPLLVDSGASTTMTLDWFNDAQMKTNPVPIAATIGIDGISLDRAGRLSADAAIGDITLPEPIVKSESKTPKIGAAFMKAHAWSFDTRRKLIRVHSGPAEITADPVKHFGFVPRLHPEGIEILRIIPQSPAAAASLQPGDLIIAINGDPVIARPPCSPELAKAADGPVRFTVVSGGETRDIELAAYTAIP